MIRRFAVSLAVVLALVGGAGVALAATLTPQYNWYLENPTASEFTITSPAQMVGLAHIVAGDAQTTKGEAIPQHDFTGQTIKCEQILNLFYLSGWKDAPTIGTAEHPFNGTFDGGTVKFSGFHLDVTDNAQNIGLFGVTGPDAVIKNVELFSTCQVKVDLTERATEEVLNVGSIVGWSQGDVIGCTSAAEVTVLTEVNATEDMPYTVRCVGGIAGRVDGNLTGCSETGSVSVAASSDSAVGQEVAERIGGLVGWQGDDGNAGMHGGDIADCSFQGTLRVDISGFGGIGSQGDMLESSGSACGGIAGLAEGNVSNCTNNSQIYAPMMARSGGIVGALLADGATEGTTDAEGKDADVIAVSHCINQDEITADIDESGVFGYVNVGGIVGYAGSSTAVTQCQNTAFVRASRWNKPSGAGIAGRICGTSVMSYCYNSGDVTNWTPNDLVEGTYTRGIGYYMAGICGTTEAVSIEGAALPATPEVHACYNRGHVLMSSTWRTGGIVGENNGSVHDCYFLDGTVQEMVSGDVSYYPSIGSNYGTSKNVSNLSQSVLCSSQGVSYLNVLCDRDDWSCYFTVNLKQSKWPELDWQSTLTDVDRTDLATGTVDATLLEDASYSSEKDPMPSLVVNWNGTRLYQNADFRVIAQEDAREVTTRNEDKAPYQASLQGIGRYKGVVLDVCFYGIAPADFSTCTVTVTAGAKEFDGSTKAFSKRDVTVTDAAGNIVDSSEYTVKFATSGTTSAWNILYPGLWQAGTRQALHAGTVDRATLASWTPGMYIDGQPTDSQYSVTDAYPVLANALDSGNYAGTALGSAHLVKATSLEEDWQVRTVDFGDGNVWTRTESGEFADGEGTAGITVTYTGGEYKPTMTVFNTDGGSKLYGKSLTSLFTDSTNAAFSRNASYGDYCFIYGADASTVDDGKDADERNTEASTDGFHASVTVRATNESVGLSDYLTVPFTIEPRDVADAAVDVYVPTQQATGRALDPVELTYNGMTLVEGVDYTVEYENNVNPGQASYAVTGKGNYTGTRTGTFDIVEGDANMISVDRAFFADNGEKNLVVRAYNAIDPNIPVNVAQAGDAVVVKAVGTASRDLKITVTDADGKVVENTQDLKSDLPLYATFVMPDSSVTITFSYDAHLTFYMREGNGELQEGDAYTATDLLSELDKAQQTVTLDDSAVLPSFLWKNSTTGRWYVTTSGSYSLYLSTLASSYITGFDDLNELMGDIGVGALKQDCVAKTTFSVLHEGQETTISKYGSDKYFFNDVPSWYNTLTHLTNGTYGSNDGFNQILSFYAETSPVSSGTRADAAAISNTEKIKGNMPFDRTDVDSSAWGISFLCGMTTSEFKADGNITDARFVKNVDGLVFNVPGNMEKATVTYDVDGNIHAVYDRNGIELTKGVDYTVKYEKVTRTATISPTEDSNYVGSLKVQLPATTLAGATALDTMSVIAQNAYTAGASQAVVCTSDDYHDALAAASYAHLIDGPILLTGSGGLSDQTRQDIIDQGIQKVTIIGGAAWVSQEAEQQLRDLLGSQNVSRISGQTATDTACKVYAAGAGQWSNTCIVVSGQTYADALSASPFAFANSSPIFMTGEEGTLDQMTMDTIKEAGFQNIVVAGGTYSVSKNSYEWLARVPTTKQIVRLAGDNQYGTSAAFSQWLVEDAKWDGYTDVAFSYTATAFATGKSFQDALAAGALQGRVCAPLLLYDRDAEAYDVENLIDLRAAKFKYIVFVGGTYYVPDTTKYYITKLLGWDEFVLDDGTDSGLSTGDAQ